MVCVECGAVAEDEARGWRVFRSDLTAEAEAEDTSARDVPAVVYYRPACAAREFDTSEARSAARGRRRGMGRDVGAPVAALHALYLVGFQAEILAVLLDRLRLVAFGVFHRFSPLADRCP